MTHQNLKFIVFVFKVYVSLTLLHLFEITVVFRRSTFEFVASKGSDEKDIVPFLPIKASMLSSELAWCSELFHLPHGLCSSPLAYTVIQLRGEWLSGLYSLRQVTEVKLGRVRSNSGWVTLEA